jgi:S1-C subfamily serine protease
MKARILAALAALSLLVSPVLAFDWVGVATATKQSVVEIASTRADGNGSACTGAVIDDDRDFVLTAAHCDGVPGSVFVDNLPAEVRAKDEKRDLLVLYVKGIDRPALKLAKADPKVGEEVASYGYGYALEQPLFRVAHISAGDIAVERARLFTIDASFVSGQSGGPVVNTAGEIVMIVQLGNPYVGLGVGAEVLEDKVGRFFSSKK